MQVGGEIAPFIAMGLLVLVLIVPCGLMVKKLSESRRPTMRITNIIIECSLSIHADLNGKRGETLPMKVILRIVTSLPIILVGKA